MDINKGSLFTLDNVAYGIIAAVVFLSPFFFLPFLGISAEFAKISLLEIGVLLAFLLWLVARLRDGVLSFPRSGILAAAVLVPFITLVAGIFSGQARVSLMGIGTGAETITFLGIITFTLLMVLAALFFGERKRLLTLYAGLFVGAFIIASFQVARFIGGTDFLSFGLFGGPTDNVLGKWNDLGLFFGMIVLLSVLILQFLLIRGAVQWVLRATLVASIVFLAIIDFSPAWILLGIFSLAAFVYGLSFGSGTGVAVAAEPARRRLPFTPLIVAIIALVFLLPGDLLTGAISSKLNIQQIEVRPSWSATYDITKETFKEDSVFGVGPNRFNSQWLLHKPAGVNETLFWNSDFNFGIGIIPSAGVTMGIAGILAWLSFLGVFVYFGGRAALTARTDALARFGVVSSFFLALYLWVAAIFYVPGVAMFAFAFLFTGIYVALLTKEGTIKTATLSFLGNPRFGFLSVLIIIILVIVSVVGEYILGQRFVAASFFGRGITTANISGDLARAEAFVGRASQLYKSDVYYRALTEVQVARLGNILSQKDVGQDTLRTQFQEGLGNAISNARAAKEYDPTNYQNWLSLGRVYEAVVPLGIEGAYDNATAAYHEALLRNPHGPAMYVIFARLEVTKGNTAKAKEYLNTALAEKSNYTEAIFLLSQIEAQEGNIREAIAQTERASLIAPNDTGIFFQLGFLRYKGGDYEGAISALERAVILNPVYANAKYFLGLAYDRAGRRDDAILQFNDILILNPGNVEVESILENLRAGTDPFASIVPPEEPPEERTKPPIEE